jgi:predicted DNA-binding transcriptional regulator AlpA
MGARTEEQMNPDRVIRERDLQQYDGLAHTRRWDLVMSGEYPQPFKLTPNGRHKAWLASEIAAYQAWRKAVRDGTAAKKATWKDYLTPTTDELPSDKKVR